jgi:hypothetical protein
VLAVDRGEKPIVFCARVAGHFFCGYFCPDIGTKNSGSDSWPKKAGAAWHGAGFEWE